VPVRKNILIGIYWPSFSSEQDIINTIDTIILSAGNLCLNIVVLADGNKIKLNSDIQSQCNIVRSETYRGRAYSFNRLIACGPADFFVFLEAGIFLGPDCLSLLINTLNESKEYGLAGPSTNTCWNEQSRLPFDYLKNNYRSLSSQAKNKYEKESAELLPLHSLADFCYLIKKEVVETIGGADEAYGTGGCWEMDFNIRAARSGFKGIWVKGAFAFRTLIWPPEDLQKNKQVYQSRFCALQIQKQKTNFKAHCRGEQCSNFALSSLIKIKIDLPAEQIPLLQTGFRTLVPMVSCIMPTSGRPHFVKQAIQFFIQQDYPNKELIIVYNDDKDISAEIDWPINVRLIKTPVRSIGAKRNEGCKHVRGSILAQWDDDDIYMSNRLSVQVGPLLKGECELTGLNNYSFYEVETNSYWTCTPGLFKKLFVENVGGGTLVYLKSIWQNYAVYPHISLREDAEFLVAAMRKGARLERIDGKDIFIYFRHTTNTWRFAVGTYLKPDEWQLSAAPVVRYG
jgi:GT2 family glycosyltransferase